MNALLRRLRLDPYILAIMAMVALAAALPARGMGKDALDHVVVATIAILFFLYGARISPQAIWTGITHWRLQGLVFATTFVVFPLIGFAVVHMPPNSEAPHGAAYIKFLAIDARHRRPEHLHLLLAAVEDVATGAQLSQVVAPVYTYYWSAYQVLLERGYHADFTMVRMKRGKPEDGEDSNDLVLDDWR